MAERRRVQRSQVAEVEDDTVQEQEETSVVEESVSSPMHQLHEVPVDSNVFLNGSVFTIDGQQYAWMMTCPDGSEGMLMNPTMPSPSFIASNVGDYTITLQTSDGVAEIIVRVS